MENKDNPISHALSKDARDYLTKVFECTTFQHLMALSAPAGDTGLNVFDENVREHPGGGTRFDQEIGGYILAVQENREPYDPEDHEFDVESSDSGYVLLVCGICTGGEWESLGPVDDESPSQAVRERMFNQSIAPHEDTQTYYPQEGVRLPQEIVAATIRPIDKIHFPSCRKHVPGDKHVEVWQDKLGTIQIRLIDNADGLITRITISGGGVERLWHPGTDGDEDDVQEVFLKLGPWPQQAQG